MTLAELGITCLLFYTLLGGMCALAAAAADSSARMILFAFFCWPAIAFHGLRLLIGRMR